ncbi:MAG: transporter substrate-binding domain-containing protein [Nitrospirales bacterium]|nr:transporter substrate-binding domain-containing protein [Nitrospirales bacterium]
MIVLLLCCGCGSADDASSSSPTTASTSPVSTYREAGDLHDILSHGRIRVLSPPLASVEHLPRQGTPHHIENQLLDELAGALHTQVHRVQVDHFHDLIPALLDGRGDMIAAHFTITPERQEQIDFTVPVAIVREQLITRKTDTGVNNPADLKGRTIVARKSSAFWQTAQRLKKQHPGIAIKEAPDHLDTEQVLDGVARGLYDVSIADNDLMQAMLTYRSDLRAAFDLTGDRAVAWGVRPHSTALLERLNTFLSTAKLAQSRPTLYTGDLGAIKQHRVLRVLTRNNPATYFLWRGELLGFEYELSRHFAQAHKLRVEMVVPPRREDLIPWLIEGKGDIVAASMTITPERKSKGVTFSRPYFKSSEIVVTRAEEPESKLQSTQDLAGRTVAIRRSSSYWPTIKALQKQGIDVKLEEVPEELETEEIISRLAKGKYDLTVADSHLLDIELTWREDIRAAFPLGEPRPHGWVIRDSNPELLKAVNAFLKKTYRGVFYNLTVQKYFENKRDIRLHVEHRASRTGELSPYDEIVKPYAKQYEFDWRMIVAQMYQESRFNPDARSWAGAVGLMQVLPQTAKSLGFPDIRSPKEGIHAGVKYLNWVRDRFEPELSVKDRMWFTLAAYNVGHGHVLDARRVARQEGLNPNRWFGNVEHAIRLLSKRKYARKARHGYCRCSEPVKYVREIKQRYEAYVQVTGR